MGRVLVAVLLATLAACGMPARTGRPNILLVVIDTLRADRLGCYGNARGLTPFLDELAARGHVVRRARAQAPWTNPSVASIFTSRYQSQHRVIDYRSVLPATELTLAEVLKANGYVTGGFSANGLIGESLGFGQGFDQYQAHLLVKGEDPEYMRIPVRADRIAAEALAWLDQLQRDGAAGAPVFLYLQLMEPHAPYAPPAALLDRLRDGRPVDVRRASESMYLDSLTPVGADELRQIEDVYDASVMAVDLALRDLFAALDAHGFFADAIVVVTADHGEEFQDHGLRGHGKALFDESIHVPLIVLPPGTTVPGDVDRLVSSIDIAPTVLELAGVPIPDRFGGQSFASELEGGWWARSRSALRQLRNAPPAGSSYSENLVPPDVPALPHERALVADDSKIIEWRDGASRFYDLAHDPQEQAPNSVDDAGRARLETSLSQAEARAERDPSLAETKMPDARTREALEALGYIQ